MEPESSLSYSQMPTTCPYPEPIPSSPHNPFPLPKIHLNINPPIYVLVSPMVSFLQVFPTKTLCTPLSSSVHATCPAHLILLHFITRTILGEEYRELSSSLCNFLHSLVTSSLLGPNIFLNTLFWNILSLCFSLNVSDQVSHSLFQRI